MYDKKLLKAVRRKAYGYESREITEEYAVADGAETLVRRKVRIFEVAPDLAAARMLIELEPDNRELSYDELAREKQRLMREWLQEKGGQ